MKWTNLCFGLDEILSLDGEDPNNKPIQAALINALQYLSGNQEVLNPNSIAVSFAQAFMVEPRLTYLIYNTI